MTGSMLLILGVALVLLAPVHAANESSISADTVQHLSWNKAVGLGLTAIGAFLFTLGLLMPRKASRKAAADAKSVMRNPDERLNSTFLFRQDMTLRMNEDLVRYLQEEGALRTPRLIAAFNAIDRGDFVPQEYREYAYIDRPLPLGSTGALLQPTTVAFMLELLQPQEGEKMMHAGMGAGWITALLTYITNVGGIVYGVEMVSALSDSSNENLHKYYPLQCIVESQEQPGLVEKAPFDRMFVSSMVDDIPEELIHQLNIGGMLVAPVQNTVVRIQRMSTDKYSREEFPGFVFVPIRR